MGGRRGLIAHTDGVRYASLTSRLHGEGSRVWAVHERGYELQAEGRDIILLSIGEPDFPAPPPIIDALVDSIRRGRNYYTPSSGELSIRSAIARHVSQYAKRTVTSGEVVFMPGAQAALFAVCLVLAEKGDEILLPEPSYATYEGVMASTGAAVVHVPLHAARGFHLDPADVAARITDRTRVLILNTPHNPSGAALSPATLAELGELCRAHDLWLVADEVYADLVYDGEHASALAIRRLRGPRRRRRLAVQVARHDRLPPRLGGVVARAGRPRRRAAAVDAVRLAAVHPGRRRGRADRLAGTDRR